MPKIVAQGQLTITDLYDMPSLTARLGSTLPKSQSITNPTTWGGADVYTPSWATTNLVVKAELFEAGNATELITSNNANIQSITWYYTIGTAAETTTLPAGVVASATGGSSRNNTITISQNKLDRVNTALKLRAVIAYRYPGMVTSTQIGTEIDFSASVQSIDSYTAIASNETFSFATNISGTTTSSQVQTCAFTVYKGAISVPAANITVTKPTDANGFSYSVSSNILTITAASGSALTGSDSGSIPVTFQADGQTFVKSLTWSKAKQGAVGNDSAMIWLQGNTDALVYDETAGTYLPASVTATGYSKTGTAAQVSYSTYYKIEHSVDGSNYTQATVSTANEASRTWNPTIGTKYKSIKISMYTPGSATTLLDSQIIPVVSEAKKPVTVTAYAPNGYTFRNGVGSLVAKVDIFKNGGTTTPTSINWYKGTDMVTSIGTTDTLAVTPSMVVSMETFTAKVVVDGTTYMDTVVIMDFTDPITPDIQASNGTVYKNSVGNTVLKCVLWRQGNVIDDLGTGYMYSWVKIKGDGSVDTAYVPVASANGTVAGDSDGMPLTGITVASVDGTKKIITLNIAPHEGLKVGQKIEFNTVNNTYYEIESINTGAKTITLKTAVTAAVVAGNTILINNYKNIVVSPADVSQKASFRCEVYTA